MAGFNGELLHSLILEPCSSPMKSNKQRIDDMLSRTFNVSNDHQTHDDDDDDELVSMGFANNILNPNTPLSLHSSFAAPFSMEFTHVNKKEKGLSGRKRKRDQSEKPNHEVNRVRVKRGQATDSHSLAERVRRQKINERLKSLQTLVPGCYKTMGMAVMFDVIIQYIQSLQNQIDFLSMKLSTATSFGDLNSSEINNAMETLVMQNTGVCEGSGMEMVATGGYGGGVSHFNPTYDHFE